MSKNQNQESGTETMKALVKTEKGEIRCEEIRKGANLTVEEWPDERLQVVLKMAAPKAKTVVHAAAFLGICKQYNLNPLVGQIFFGEIKGQPGVITGRDTWLALANREATFDGIITGVVFDGEECVISRDPADPWKVSVEHPQVFDREKRKILGSYCIVFDSRRPPLIVRRMWDNYKHLHSKENWAQNPEDMIENRSIAAGLRRMYSFPGLFIEGEELEGGEYGRAASGLAGDATKSSQDELAAAVKEAEKRNQGIVVREAFSPDNVILKAKHEGKSWREAYAEDPSYVEGVAERGQILEDAENIKALREWLESPEKPEEAPGDPEDGDEAPEASEAPSRASGDGIDDLYEKAKAVIMELGDLGVETYELMEEAGVLHVDGKGVELSNLISHVERQIAEADTEQPQPEPEPAKSEAGPGMDLFGGQG